MQYSTKSPISALDLRRRWLRGFPLWGLLFTFVAACSFAHAVVPPPSEIPNSGSLSSNAGPQPFGANLFAGNFLKARDDGVNPNYVVAPGDQVAVRTWGSVNINDTFTVDSQGNIFLPEIGPLRLEGVKNADLSDVVKGHIQKVFINNFGVYTSLVTAQPVAVYVTGLVNNPGRYAGIPSDSLLYFLDQAGGIDTEMGSYRDIDILRGDKAVAKVDLYDFILNGRIASPQFQDGDVILVRQRGAVVELTGDVARPSLVEFRSGVIKGSDVLDIVPNVADATEVTLEGMRSGSPFTHTLSLQSFRSFNLEDGDVITLRDDGRADAFLVKLEGEFKGPTTLAVKRGSRLVDVLNHIPVDQNLAQTRSIFLRRASVANAQKDAIRDSLFRLERSSLLALSGSLGETEIRVREAELMEKFAERARQIDPLGRVVVSRDGIQENILLEPNDTIVIPSKTEVVRIAGEVLMMHAVTYQEGLTAADYIKQAGGYSNRADTSKVILHHQNARVEIIDPHQAVIQPGDELLVPPKIDKKYRQYAIDLLDVIYKVAVSAKVALDL